MDPVKAMKLHPLPPLPNACILELGLKVEARKLPLDVLAVDHAEKSN